ncbi:MAG: hypothetical protein HYY51_02505 [Candidatus Magasanikbacteria bacterium]|nr:hypothetical protein [Candidatus Magasanikbacteria bacterium]
MEHKKVALLTTLLSLAVSTGPVLAQSDEPAVPGEPAASETGATGTADPETPDPVSEDNGDAGLEQGPETGETAGVADSEESAEPAAETSEETSEEAEEDARVTNEDLGVEESRVVPGDALFGVKNFFRGIGRTVQKAVTLNPVKEAELELRWSNVDLQEARQAVEEHPNDEQATEAVARVVERFEDRLQNIQDKADSLRERGASDAGVNRLLDNVIDKQIKQQKILEHIEQRIIENAPEGVAQRVVERVQEARDQASNHAAQVIARVEENQERLTERFDRVLERQTGSEFKNLRNLEVLKRIEDHVPMEARGAIRQAQENALNRFKDGFEQLPESERGDRFERYAHKVGGDETRNMEIFDQLKSVEGLPEEIRTKIERAKDISARRFQSKFEGEFGDNEFKTRARERMMQRFQDQESSVGVERMKTIQDLKERVRFKDEEIEKEFKQEEEKSIQSFVAAFPDAEADAERFRELSRQMAEKPDPNTFRLIQQLEEKVKSDPKKREFIENMEREAKSRFAERARDEGERFFEEISSNNPGDIEIFRRLQNDFSERPEDFFGPAGFAGEEGPSFDPRRFGPPQGFDRVFDRAIDAQSDRIKENLQEIRDPREFQQFQERFDIPKEVLNELERRDPGFAERFKEKRQMIESVQNEEFEFQFRQGEERQKLEQEFESRLQNAGSEEEQRAAQEERNERFRNLEAKDEQKRKEFFESHLNADPFCDEGCKAEERKRFEQMTQVDKERRTEEEEFFSIERDLRDFTGRARQENQGTEGERRDFDPANFRDQGDPRDSSFKQNGGSFQPGSQVPSFQIPGQNQGFEQRSRDNSGKQFGGSESADFRRQNESFDRNEKAGLVPLPSPMPRPEFENSGDGLRGDRSSSPDDEREKRGLIPMPSGLPGPISGNRNRFGDQFRQDEKAGLDPLPSPKPRPEFENINDRLRGDQSFSPNNEGKKKVFIPNSNDSQAPILGDRNRPSSEFRGDQKVGLDPLPSPKPRPEFGGERRENFRSDSGPNGGFQPGPGSQQNNGFPSGGPQGGPQGPFGEPR